MIQGGAEATAHILKFSFQTRRFPGLELALFRATLVPWCHQGPHWAAMHDTVGIFPVLSLIREVPPPPPPPARRYIGIFPPDFPGAPREAH